MARKRAEHDASPLEEEPLADEALNALLVDAVVEVVEVSAASRAHLSQGEGELRLRGDCLELDDVWSSVFLTRTPSK